MKTKYVLVTIFAVAALGLAIHRGFTQSPPVIVGPGLAPNVQTAPDPRSLSYYGDYFGEYYDRGLYNAIANPYNVSYGPNDIPRTPDKMTTKLTGTSVSFQWDGEPRAVQSITFELLDKNNGVVSKQVITKLPTKATLKKTAKTTGYSISIVYINGMTNTVTSPL